MSESVPPGLAPSAPAPPSRRGAVMISITAQATFFLALVAASLIAWYKQDYTLLTAMAGVAATNATTVVSYWVGNAATPMHEPPAGTK